MTFVKSLCELKMYNNLFLTERYLIETICFINDQRDNVLRWWPRKQFFSGFFARKSESFKKFSHLHKINQFAKKGKQHINRMLKVTVLLSILL